jgi:hypothetical protein
VASQDGLKDNSIPASTSTDGLEGWALALLCAELPRMQEQRSAVVGRTCWMSGLK